MTSIGGQLEGTKIAQPLITKIILKINNLTFHSNLLGVNELNWDLAKSGSSFRADILNCNNPQVHYWSQAKITYLRSNQFFYMDVNCNGNLDEQNIYHARHMWLMNVMFRKQYLRQLSQWRPFVSPVGEMISVTQWRLPDVALMAWRHVVICDEYT